MSKTPFVRLVDDQSEEAAIKKKAIEAAAKKREAAAKAHAEARAAAAAAFADCLPPLTAREHRPAGAGEAPRAGEQPAQEARVQAEESMMMISTWIRRPLGGGGLLLACFLF